jgi:DNA-binding SARP family transcriptional activator
MTGHVTPFPELVVRVLGPVEVIGASRPFRRAWCLELVTYLALHPAGVTVDAWATALWPNRFPPDATRFSTVSEARRALGRASNGSDHLPYGVSRLRLAESVTTDWTQFRALAATTGPNAVDAWAAALDLVRGPLLTGLRSTDWAVFEGLLAEVEGAVVRLSIDTAEQYLARGDGHAAERAARRGLLVAPYDERLYRMLFRAADRQGNPAGVESAMSELVRLVSGETSPPQRAACAQPADLETWVHPETVAVYRSLSRRWPRRPSNGRRFHAS